MSCHSYVHDLVNILQFAEVESPRRRVSPQASDEHESDPDDTHGFPQFSNENQYDNENDSGAFRESEEETYPGAGAYYSQDGLTFLDLFDADEYAECRKDNLFYPFASKEEWEVANFLLRSSLSMAAVDEFLNLPMVCPNTLEL